MLAHKIIVASALALIACVSSEQARPEPATPVNGVRFFGNPPVLDQSSRIGTQNAAQSFTPAAKTKALKTTLRTKWKANVGKTTARTTMVASAGRVVIGTHDGVHVLDALTGEPRALVRSPDGSAFSGVAVDGEYVFANTAKGQLLKTSLGGAVVWTASLQATSFAAPTLFDANADGTLDVAVGTGGGFVVALDGKSGRRLWQYGVGLEGRERRAVESGISAGDIDKDGRPELIVAGGEGLLVALRAADGAPLWQTRLSAPVVAAPVLSDMDLHGGLEILVASTDGTVAILDAADGHALWSARVEADDGTPEGIVAAPTLLPGPRIGAVVVATSRGAKSDGLVLLSENERRFRSIEGSVTSSPVVLRLDPESTPDAIVSTRSGDLVAIDATGGRTFLASIGAPVSASPLVTDVDGDGVRELIVAAHDGSLTCWSTGVAEAPLVARYRGDAPTNAGALGPINLGWTFARGRDAANLLQSKAGR